MTRVIGDDTDDGLVELAAAGRAEELGVAEGEHAAVAGNEPVAVSGRRRGHADDRLVEAPAAETAANTPPSEPTRHEPLPVGVEAIPTIGALSESAPMGVEGIDCALVVACAAAFFATLGVAAADLVAAPVALAVVTAVANAVSVARAIAMYAIHLDAGRLRPTITIPLG